MLFTPYNDSLKCFYLKRSRLDVDVLFYRRGGHQAESITQREHKHDLSEKEWTERPTTTYIRQPDAGCANYLVLVDGKASDICANLVVPTSWSWWTVK